MKLDRLVARLIFFFFVIDVTFIVLHVCFGWSVINLDEEGNLAAWYSSAKLLGLAALCVWIWDAEHRLGRRLVWLWLLVGLIFMGLSADETASMHERLARTIMTESAVGLDLRETVLGGDVNKDSYAWVLLLSPFILAVALFFAVFFYKRLAQHPRSLWIAFAGLGLFLLVVGLEATIYVAPSLTEWSEAHVMRYRLFLAMEETCELFGSSLFMLAFFCYGRFLTTRAVDPAG